MPDPDAQPSGQDNTDPLVAIAGNRHLARILADDAGRARLAKDRETAVRRTAAIIVIATIRAQKPDPIFASLRFAILRLGLAQARTFVLDDLNRLDAAELKLLLRVAEPLIGKDPLQNTSGVEALDLPRSAKRDLAKTAETVAAQAETLISGFRAELQGLLDAAEG